MRARSYGRAGETPARPFIDWQRAIKNDQRLKAFFRNFSRRIENCEIRLRNFLELLPRNICLDPKLMKYPQRISMSAQVTEIAELFGTYAH